jgi:hypothetical protein
MSAGHTLPESYEVVMAELRARFPGEAQWREEQLADPGWCNRNPDLAYSFKNPAKIRRYLYWQEQLADPFSEISLIERGYKRASSEDHFN